MRSLRLRLLIFFFFFFSSFIFAGPPFATRDGKHDPSHGPPAVRPTFLEYTTRMRDVCYIAETDCWRAATLPPGGGRPVASFWEMAEFDARTDGRVRTEDAKGRPLWLDFSSVARQYNGHGGKYGNSSLRLLRSLHVV